MSAPAVSLAFFDTERGLHGTARSGATVLFEGTTPTAIAEGPAVLERDGGLSAGLGGRFELEFEYASDPMRLGGVSARICRVAGEVAGTTVQAIGTAAVTEDPPVWDELDAIRSITILAGTEDALLALARRPRGAVGHGEERIASVLLHEGVAHDVEDTRLSTVYDAGGRQRSAGLELWLPGEEFPRRASGRAVAGSSLELPGLVVHAAVFDWRLEGHPATGAYELMSRAPEPAAA